MKIDLEPGKYVIAVSGGVDSMALLHMLVKKSQSSVVSDLETEDTDNRKLKTDHINSLKLIVAHFDHGIRPNSEEDRKFVEAEAKKYGLSFEYKREELGENASENLARERRYAFLETVKQKYQADAIITAHHRDDVIETAVLNLLRGTGRRGLTSLKSGKIIRPLLSVNKSEILEYAKQNNLEWRDDPTNEDIKYTRNIVRKMLKNSDQKFLSEFDEVISDSKSRNEIMDTICEEVFNEGYNGADSTFSRQYFIALPHSVGKEVLAFWLRKLSVEFDKQSIQRLAVGLKVAKSGAKLDIDKRHIFVVTNKQISIEGGTFV